MVIQSLNLMRRQHLVTWNPCGNFLGNVGVLNRIADCLLGVNTEGNNINIRVLEKWLQPLRGSENPNQWEWENISPREWAWILWRAGLFPDSLSEIMRQTRQNELNLNHFIVHNCLVLAQICKTFSDLRDSSSLCFSVQKSQRPHWEQTFRMHYSCH